MSIPSMNYEEANANVLTEVNNTITELCGTKSNRHTIPTCQLSETDIENISHFLSNVIPKCEHLGITLDNIRNGKILSKGTFGYGFLSGSKDKVIKIIVCPKRFLETKYTPEELDESISNLAEEIDLHKTLTNTKNSTIARLLGFYTNNNDESKYIYYGMNTNFNEEQCIYRATKTNPKDLCEIYLILEAGQFDLTNYIINVDTIGTFTKSIQNLLSEYVKISYSLNKFFKHNDVKMENMIVMKDSVNSFKFIDFGLSQLTENFFSKGAGGTEYFYKILFTYIFENEYGYDRFFRINSQLFDIFCVLITLFEKCLDTRFYMDEFADVDKKTNITYILFSKIKTQVVTFIKSHSNKKNKKNLKILYLLMVDIYEFHQSKIIEFFSKNLSEQLYLKLYNISDFEMTDFDSVNFDSDADFIEKKREYFGPVNIQKLKIQLLNQYGEILNLNYMDFSFSLELEVAYDI